MRMGNLVPKVEGYDEGNTSLWGSLLGNTGDDVELYERTANSYKLSKSWDKAGSTYLKLARTHLKLGENYQAASAYAAAGNCFKKTQMKEAIESLKHAVGLFIQAGRLIMAARYLKDIGEAYENEENLEDAMKSYEQAADLYSGEEQSSSANSCSLKVAHIAALLEQYPKAIEIFETVANESLNHNLLKYGVNGHLLNAGICHICRGGAIAVYNALQKYQDWHPTFESTRECKFLQAMSKALDEVDIASFTSAVREFDSLSRLDSWKSTLLLRAKKALQEEEDRDDLT